MKCKICKTEWSIAIQGSSMQKFCPVCGNSIVVETEKQLTTLEETLFVIKRDYGMRYLQDSARIMAYVSDLAPHLKKERVLLQYLVQCNGNALLIASLQKNDYEQQLCKKQLVARMVDELFLTETAAQTICTSFWNAITSEQQPQRKLTPEEAYEKSCACENGDIDEALRLLTQAAEAGYLPAQSKLAKWYHNGQVVEKNPEKALRWYKAAAAAGDAEAECNLGWCYATGFGCPVNPVVAAAHFEKASSAGVTIAQYNLAKCYESGAGVEKDLNRAASLYKEAAYADYTKAQYCLARCYANGIGVAASPEIAIFWYKKAAKKEFVNAQFALGDCYERGIGVEKDCDIAYYWYNKAAKNGHLTAQKKLSQFK